MVLLLIMKVLYFDCKNGISGDMMLKALMELAGCKDQIETAMNENFQTAESLCVPVIVHDEPSFKGDGCGDHHDDHHNHVMRCTHASCEPHRHSHGRSYQEVVAMIKNSGFSSRAKETAHNIYRHIAEAEAKVHGASLETVHFHEVGRDEAIKNALGIGMALEAIAPDAIYTSAIYDGKGTVVCSHGEIPVPVPAVMALREKCSYVFQQADINMELVTPSGLASLMGIGAMPDECGRMDALQGMAVSSAEAKGSRDTKRPGLRAYLIEHESGDPAVLHFACEEDVH